MTYEDHINAVAECVLREDAARKALSEAEVSHEDARSALNEANRALRDFNEERIGAALVTGGSHV